MLQFVLHAVLHVEGKQATCEISDRILSIEYVPQFHGAMKGKLAKRVGSDDGVPQGPVLVGKKAHHCLEPEAKVEGSHHKR